MTTRIRTYTDLLKFSSFEDRFEYLALRGNVGHATFGFDRYMNQMFYTSREWRNVRWEVIARDSGCDLAVPGYEIHGKLTIHHMNPISPEDIKHGSQDILDPRFLITTTHSTHNAIHYGDQKLLRQPFVERHPGDTKLW